MIYDIESRVKQIFWDIFVKLPQNENEWMVLAVEGWDSIAHVLLMQQIEKEFSIKIPTKDYLKCVSYKKIIEEIRMSESRG